MEKELSIQEKNDIIATKIMGWTANKYGAIWLFKDGGFRRRDGVNPFNPCGSLDDCYLAEEKMCEDELLQVRYVGQLLAELGALSKTFAMIHAAPMQKVSAMLKALEVSV